MKFKIFLVIIFAVAFAFVEAAVVVYLRHLLGSAQPEVGRNEILLLLPGVTFLEPQTAVKIISDTSLLNVERIREASTLIMLASVAALAAKNLRQRLAFFALAFGIWDIFYYVFLNLTIGWPKSLFDLDVFFLLPTPWAGPVAIPLIISSILITGSLIYLNRSRNGNR
ncbi:hypothetical protein HYU92_05235 [Candidatus Curtissbacteria bacterium]|nr:hypothetical protein [Candidatus Curtissbacteria bacterium]